MTRDDSILHLTRGYKLFVSHVQTHMTRDDSISPASYSQRTSQNECFTL